MPVKPKVSVDESTLVTDEKARFVVPVYTVKSPAEMPSLKSTPVMLIVGLTAASATVEELAISFGAAGMVKVIGSVAITGCTANACGLARTEIVPGRALPLNTREI